MTLTTAAQIWDSTGASPTPPVAAMIARLSRSGSFRRPTSNPNNDLAARPPVAPRKARMASFMKRVVASRADHMIGRWASAEMCASNRSRGSIGARGNRPDGLSSSSPRTHPRPRAIRIAEAAASFASGRETRICVTVASAMDSAEERPVIVNSRSRTISAISDSESHSDRKSIPINASSKSSLFARYVSGTPARSSGLSGNCRRARAALVASRISRRRSPSLRRPSVSS